MIGSYLGHLPEHDPLFGYLKHEIFPPLSGGAAPRGFRVFRTSGSNAVYMYEEVRTNIRMIGKFFLSRRMTDTERAAGKLEREFHNLVFIRSRGFDAGLHYVARPLGKHYDLGCLLMEEFCYGEPLDKIILRAIHERDDSLLYGKLTALAYFLATMHNRTAENWRVDFDSFHRYGRHIIDELCAAGITGGMERNYLADLCGRWYNNSCMWEDCQVVVHGDATPSNFLFGDGLHVIAFDLERTRRADRVFDVGRLVGELFHFFLQNTGNKYAAEPFIGHFIWEYSCHFPDRESAFRSIVRRIPCYMGITLLRIARNRYLKWDYRRRLVEEAKLCLEGVK